MYFLPFTTLVDLDVDLTTPPPLRPPLLPLEKAENEEKPAAGDPKPNWFISGKPKNDCIMALW